MKINWLMLFRETIDVSGENHTNHINLQNLRSSGILRCVVWYLFTDVSGQPIGPIFTGQESRVGLLTDTLSRNVGKQLPLDAV
jgi:hypothetical protein